MASVRHLGLFPAVNNNFDGPCLPMVPEYYEGRDDRWHKVTPEQATKIYWRVKKWQIVVDGVYNEPIYELRGPDEESPVERYVLVGYNSFPVTSNTQYDPTARAITQFDPTPPFEQETDLVCKLNAGPYWAGVVANGIFIDALFVASGDFGYNADIKIRKDENGELFVAFTAMRTVVDDHYVLPVTFTDDLDNPLQFSFSWSGSDEDGHPSSGTAIVKPLEWWEYDAGDGLGPIYDKTTGAQLR